LQRYRQVSPETAGCGVEEGTCLDLDSPPHCLIVNYFKCAVFKVIDSYNGKITWQPCGFCSKAKRNFVSVHKHHATKTYVGVEVNSVHS